MPQLDIQAMRTKAYILKQSDSNGSVIFVSPERGIVPGCA